MTENEFVALRKGDKIYRARLEFVYSSHTTSFRSLVRTIKTATPRQVRVEYGRDSYEIFPPQEVMQTWYVTPLAAVEGALAVAIADAHKYHQLARRRATVARLLRGVALVGEDFKLARRQAAHAASNQATCLRDSKLYRAEIAALAEKEASHEG
jgi:hypothetical protein